METLDPAAISRAFPGAAGVSEYTWTSIRDTPIEVAWIQMGRRPAAGELSSGIARNTVPLYYEYQVDTPVSVITLLRPQYPDSLRARNAHGEVVILFVVDTTGHVERGSARVLRTTHAAFAKAALATLPAARLTPAVRQGKHVRQLVEQAFIFQPPSGSVDTALSGRTIFTDSAMYRAQCKQADTIAKLSPIPRTCTLRDQRVKFP